MVSNKVTSALINSLVTWLGLMFGVWLIDQGIDAVQFGLFNTFLIAAGISFTVAVIYTTYTED